LSPVADWPTDEEAHSQSGAARRGRAVAAVVLVLITTGAVSAVLLRERGSVAHPGGTPAVVSERVRLTSCGSYKAQPVDYRSLPPQSPTTPIQESVDRCLLAAYEDGKPAEILVTTPVDDVGSHSILYYRVRGPGLAELIIEDIPSRGRIDARVVVCQSLTTGSDGLSCS
jgi:hypothetical protein